VSFRLFLRTLRLLVLGMLGMTVCSTLSLPAGPLLDDARAETPADQRFISIDFDNVDLNVFIKYISELTGQNFVVDPSVQGRVTIVSPARISEADALQVFESVLEINGYATVAAGAVTKIVPRATARSQNVDLIGPSGEAAPRDRVVTRLVPLTHVTPLEMNQVLKPLIAKTSVIIAHTQSGMLIITDTQSNIKRLLSIIESLDVPDSRENISVIPLEHANVMKVGTILQAIFDRSGSTAAKAGGAGARVRVIPYERINALIVLAAESEAARVRSLVDRLDVESDGGASNIHVVYLQNAMAAELAQVLTALPRKTEGEQESPKTTAISEDVAIMADEETNALIVTASRAEFKVLEAVIEKLDIPRRMVYLEALIMEVDVEKSFDVGVQWFGGSEVSGGDGVAFGGFSGDPAYGSLSGLAESGVTALSTGLSLGVLTQGIEIGGVTFPDIAAILNAYKADEDIHIIATPQILTTDNMKAAISVGENIPYITSQNTTSSEQDYTQYEYKDVATKLEITQHIGQADTLRLEIETEVIKLQGDDDSLTPTTFKRTAQTTVVVENNDTVVIGGIIGQDGTEVEQKVPLLGDIPLLGWLFKSRTTVEQRTNMFIFVTPRIVSNPADIARVTQEKEKALGKVMDDKKKELLPSDPGLSVRLADQGFELLRDGNIAQAKRSLEEALAIDPVNPYALINLGVAHEKAGEYDRAAQLYRRLIETGTQESVIVEQGGEPASYHLLEIAKENLKHAENLIQK